MKHVLTAIALATTAMTATQAVAYEPGDFFVRGGFAIVSPDSDSDAIAIPALDIGPIDGTSVEVDDNTQLGLTLTYMLSDSFGVELLASTPFTHDITADLTPIGRGNPPVGETTHLPPTLSAVWYFMGSSEQVKPYLGAGINYTIFFDEEVSSELEALTGELAGAAGPVPLDMDLDDSLGLALTAGFDYELNESWHMNATIRWVDISTKANITNPDLGSVITVDNIDIDPWVYQLNIGYKF